MAKEFTVYSIGLVHCSVCASNKLSRKKVEELTNGHNPTGISSRWEISKENFAAGASNPCPCPDNPETHKHYLMVC